MGGAIEESPGFRLWKGVTSTRLWGAVLLQTVLICSYPSLPVAKPTAHQGSRSGLRRRFSAKLMKRPVLNWSTSRVQNRGMTAAR